MRKRHRLFLVVIGAFLFPVGAMGQQPVHWQPTLESAKRLAARTDRLVLIHFWADWCQACRKMEQEVFSREEVVSALQTHYVPVKINADYFPATRQQYGVTTLPADVIITPQGQLIERIQGLTAAPQYVGQLYGIAGAAKGGGPETYAQGPGGPSPAMVGRADPPGNAPAYQSPHVSGQPEPRYADYYKRQSPAPAAPLAQAKPTRPPPPIQIAPGNPPLDLDGYCPVELVENSRWALGDRRWGARHRGRTYLFSGPEQQRRFMTQPDRYAPVLAGNDVVVALDQGQTVQGYREHGVFFGNKVYLFASEANLEKFSANANYYATQILQAMQPRGYERRQYR